MILCLMFRITFDSIFLLCTCSKSCVRIWTKMNRMRFSINKKLSWSKPKYRSDYGRFPCNWIENSFSSIIGKALSLLDLVVGVNHLGITYSICILWMKICPFEDKTPIMRIDIPRKLVQNKWSDNTCLCLDWKNWIHRAGKRQKQRNYHFLITVNLHRNI